MSQIYESEIWVIVMTHHWWVIRMPLWLQYDQVTQNKFQMLKPLELQMKFFFEILSILLVEIQTNQKEVFESFP